MSSSLSCKICLRALRRSARAYATAVEQPVPTAADEKEASNTARAERSLRRFWRTVDVDSRPEGHVVRLDKRNLKTPSGQQLVLPRSKLTLATLIALEWDSQDKMLKPHSLPLTSLASRALDGLDTPEKREGVIQDLARYMDTDTESKPSSLVRLQEEHWKPLLAWINERYGLAIKPYDNLLGGRQTPETHKVLTDVVRKYDAFRLAAFERAVLASKSYLIALALLESHYTAEEAALSSTVEVRSQIELWGEVEDTHDVDREDIRSRLGSAAIVLIDAA